VSGDVFVSAPAGGDAYLLSRALHDCDDGDAGRILATCRSAMAPGVRKGDTCVVDQKGLFMRRADRDSV
jgi:hypothetical protein